jgi:pimeloyl-ACP methyl ester carboxylesterase
VKVLINGTPAHASTGGAETLGDGPAVLLIHGAGMDSTVWQLQTRYLAHRGFRALAVDLPAHGGSAGEPLRSIEAMADWLRLFLDELGIAQAHLVGHSMGTFISLELAGRNPERVASMTLCGTAPSMPVHPELLRTASEDLPAAAALMTSWSHDRPAHIGRHPTPGMWMLGGARALVERSNPGVLATDFGACMSYTNAPAAAASARCPTSVVIGLGDKMTPPKSGRILAAALNEATVVELPSTGHMMMTENPRAVRNAIVDTVNIACAR